MEKRQKKHFIQILCAAVFFVGAIVAGQFSFGKTSLFSLPFFSLNAIQLLFYIAYAISAYRVLWKALRNIFKGQIFDENFLMSIASLGALFLGESAEGVAVMLFYQIGVFFENMAVVKSRKSIASLVAIRPDYANLLLETDGSTGSLFEKRVDPYDVKVGDKIIIRPGERVPLDGIVLEGFSSMDTAALTGESLPYDVLPNSNIYSGSVNLSGVLVVRVTKIFEESTVSKILELVENAASKKASTEKFITKFARIYTPAVVIIAAVLAIVPPLLVNGAQFADWLYRAMVFLVISCPCALVISVPLSFFAGIGAASKIGVLIKGSNYLEALSRTDTIVFDKTGTLTTGTFTVEKIFAAKGVSEKALLELAAQAEYHSNHPLALSLKQAAAQQTAAKIEPQNIHEAQEISGKGISVVLTNLSNEITTSFSLIASQSSIQVSVGNERLMADLGIDLPHFDFIGSMVHLAVNDRYAGSFGLSDPVKADAKEALAQLKKLGISKTVMLSGDLKEIANKIGGQLGIQTVFAELLPDDKVARLEQLLAEKSSKKSVLFLGDGINDAPALARADVGVAMGGLGSDAAIEAADIVIMNDELPKLAKVIAIAKKTVAVAQQNIVFALGIKALIIVLGAAGYASMWAAVFADVGVSILAILNSIRLLRIKG